MLFTAENLFHLLTSILILSLSLFSFFFFFSLPIKRETLAKNLFFKKKKTIQNSRNYTNFVLRYSGNLNSYRKQLIEIIFQMIHLNCLTTKNQRHIFNAKKKIMINVIINGVSALKNAPHTSQFQFRPRLVSSSTRKITLKRNVWSALCCQRWEVVLKNTRIQTKIWNGI